LLAASPPFVGLDNPVIVGAVRVLFVRVWVAAVPTTTPDVATSPCTDDDASVWLFDS
jgi:hypothetical protein